MAGVAWVKITTDMFDNRKIKHLRRLPDGNNIVLIWVMLLTMAGRCNAGGMIFLTENIPYTPKMLADELDFEENTVILALQALEQFNMIVTDGACFRIAGWEEYQNVEGLDKIREQNRLRQQRKRGKTKQALIGDGNTCAYCGEAGSTVDHIVPLAKGGANVPENTVCSCLSCNMRKTDRPVHEFLNEMLQTDRRFDAGRILANERIMQVVAFDHVAQRFVSRDVTLHVTDSHAPEEERESDIKNIRKKNNYMGDPADTPERKRPTRTPFNPPTVEEVRAYCTERGNSVDPEAFIDFYESKGWMIGKNKMRDWKAAVRTWEQSDKRKGVKNGGGNRQSPEGSTAGRIGTWL